MDWRNIENGYEIPTEYYSDQPYLIETDDGAWVCCLTTGESHEGMPGQYVKTMRSTDCGKTWIDMNRMEPKGAPENSYAVLLKTNFGRIYCFYNFNKDNIREVTASNPPYEEGICRRVDSLGYYAFRYSDDNGKTWSSKRGEVPVRKFKMDYENVYKGEIVFFWNVGKPLIDGTDTYLSIHKVGELGEGFFVRSEGALVKSSNILTEKDITKLEFETLPEGDIGLRAPKGGGSVSEEQSYVSLSDGSFFVVYRTIDGRAAFSYSRDKGKTWDMPQYMPVRNPRAANFVWKLDSGEFLYWFHNHGGKWYDDRNPAWCIAGKEADSCDGKIIEWSEPEILLYTDDPYTRISYPDLIQKDGVTYISETQKDIGRVHEIDSAFMKKLFTWDCNEIINEGLIFDGGSGNHTINNPGPLLQFGTFGPAFGTLDLRSGFSIEVLTAGNPSEGTVLFDNRCSNGSGYIMTVIDDNRVKLEISDGMSISSWLCDSGALNKNINHIIVTVDGGPKVISYVINGRFNDGGNERQFGWGRYNTNLRHVNGSGEIYISNHVFKFRLYNRALMSAEAKSNFELFLRGGKL